jgi:uncharacterized protein YndB with AHSA1/START domain
MRGGVFGILCGLSVPAMASEPILRDRDTGAHVIEYEVTLDAPPDEVFRLWSTADGLRQFLAPGARVGATVGGPYQITFDPEGDPEGAKHGTKGALLLHILPGKELAAEWTFPPLGEKLNTRPFPTWIELRFDPAPGATDRTRLHFAHYGFADDPDWKKAFDFFDAGNWPLVLNRLIVLCRDGVAPEWAHAHGEQIDLFLRKRRGQHRPVGRPHPLRRIRVERPAELSRRPQGETPSPAATRALARTTDPCRVDRSRFRRG